MTWYTGWRRQSQISPSLEEPTISPKVKGGRSEQPHYRGKKINQPLTLVLMSSVSVSILFCLFVLCDDSQIPCKRNDIRTSALNHKYHMKIPWDWRGKVTSFPFCKVHVSIATVPLLEVLKDRILGTVPKLKRVRRIPIILPIM